MTKQGYDSLGDYTRAIAYQQERLALARSIQDRQGEGLALNNLGVTLLHFGQLVEATETFQAGIAIWEQLRSRLGNNDADKVSIFEEQARTYRLLQKALIAENQIAAALEIAERGRARAFIDLLASRLSSDATNQAASFPVSSLSINQIRQIAHLHNATLVEYSIIYETLELEGQATQPQELELFIWVVSPTGEVNFRQVNLKLLREQKGISLENLVVSTRKAINVQDNLRTLIPVRRDLAIPVNPVKLLQELYCILIHPIVEFLPQNEHERVIFIPQQSLFLAPFPALIDLDGKYLIQKHTIFTAPAIQVLEMTRLSRSTFQPTTQEVFVLGNPSMPSVQLEIGQPPQRLTPLWYAEEEAKAVASLFNTQALTGQQATKEVTLQRMASAKIIHLATHGLLYDFSGSNVPGAIALAPSSNDNGLLTATEILGLRLDAELVVLSACNTGRGRITGDGVIGLSRSLILARVPSIIVSLWAIPDAPTAELMTEFYRQLKQNSDKAQALREAMCVAINQNLPPINWAAFTLIGAAD